MGNDTVEPIRWSVLCDELEEILDLLAEGQLPFVEADAQARYNEIGCLWAHPLWAGRGKQPAEDPGAQHDILWESMTKDDPGFIDAAGYGCEDWVGWSCVDDAAAFGYTERGLAAVLVSCPESCVRPPLSVSSLKGREDAVSGNFETVGSFFFRSLSADVDSCLLSSIGGISSTVRMMSRDLRVLFKRTWRRSSLSVRSFFFGILIAAIPGFAVAVVMARAGLAKVILPAHGITSLEIAGTSAGQTAASAEKSSSSWLSWWHDTRMGLEVLADGATLRALDRRVVVTRESQRDLILSVPSGSEHRINDLDLSKNRLSRLPSSIGILSNLMKLSASSCGLRELPSEIASLKCLEVLNLQGNFIEKLPHEIGKLTSLKSLDLSRNRLTALPDSVTPNPPPYFLLTHLPTSTKKDTDIHIR